MRFIRRQTATFMLAVLAAALLFGGAVGASSVTGVGVGPVSSAHAWNTYNVACAPYSPQPGSTTNLCFDLAARWMGSYWQYRESGWSTDGATQAVWHFQLRD